MEESRRPPAPANKRKKESPSQYVKRGCVALAASIEQGLAYLKATVLGLTMKLTAKTEKEATDADLQTAKMQVDAADHAEAIKKGLA